MPLNVDDIETFDELEDDEQDLDQSDEPSNDEATEEEADNFNNLDEDLEEEIENSGSDDEEQEEDDIQEPEGEEDFETDEESEEDEPEDESEEDVRFVDDLASQFGLDPEEDLDEDLDDTWDDALKVARKGAENLAQQEVNNFFEQYPDIKNYAEYRVNGGDPDKYQEEVLNAPSYEDLEVEGNEQTQERLVREKLREVEGLSDEKVDQKVENYKSAGILKSEAEDSKDILANRQEKRQQELIEQQEKKAEKRKKERQKEQERYKKTIHESDNLAGLQIPENQKDSFESYLFDPVNDEGHTQAELDYQEMDREQALALYYLTYQGIDNLDKLVDNKASTKRAEKLSNQLSKNRSRDVNDKSQTGGGRRKNKDANLEGFDLDSAIG